MNELFYEDLKLIQNDQQQEIAFTSMGNTAVIAGPGSGKTRVLTLKAISLSKSHIKSPSGLACISFSRESVRELKKRMRLYGYTATNKDFIGTVHSFSLLHVIQPFAHLYPQYNVHYPIKILPKEVGNRIYQTILQELDIENSWNLPLVDINRYRSLSIAGRSVVQITSPKLIIKAAAIYEHHLNKTDYLDFISIINISAKIIREQEFVRKSLQSQFPWILVDEYQDLGKALHEMVLELVFNAGMKLYAVGDVNQSIYGFNGGYPDFLQELTEYADIKPIHLATNYRSSQYIIDASLAALQPPPPYPEYKAKKSEDTADFTFITCDEEMEEQYVVVAKKVIPNLLSKKIPLNEIGIITNSNTEIQMMAKQLQMADIPFFIAKWGFENSAVVVWLQECALWCTNSEWQSFEALFKFWLRLLTSHNDPRKNWERIRLKTLFYSALYTSQEKPTVFEWLEYIISELRLVNTLIESEIYPNELDNLQNVVDEARLRNLKNAKISRFAKLGAPDNEVTISTRHSSKGLEFEAVIMLGMEEERFPSYLHFDNPVALAEAQRICYVCISRAKKACILTRSKVYTLQTKNGPWRKNFVASRYWTVLFKKFGTQQNNFTNKTY